MTHHSYNHMATLIRHARVKKKLTQTETAQAIGMGTGIRKGQFISNAERALCGIPVKYWRRTCEVLSISHEQIKAAHLHDISESLDREYYK